MLTVACLLTVGIACPPPLQCVAFIKGTRTQPECGFSHKMITILNTLKAEYEVVNVLDEVHNPGAGAVRCRCEMPRHATPHAAGM